MASMSDAPSRSPSRHGRTLKLYLVDGTPLASSRRSGVSSLRAAVASRTALPELVRREEAGRTGLFTRWTRPGFAGREAPFTSVKAVVGTRLAAHDADDSRESSPARC